MKALLTATASALLLLAAAPSFAQTSNGMGSGATTNAPAATSADQNWQRQPALSQQNAPASAGIDYGMPANGTYQSGRPINQGGFTEPTFGHH
ncbi:MAG TPA: hypothetical protein VGN31_03700 [Paraburkholderia sp.]|jgi:hypothetical protein